MELQKVKEFFRNVQEGSNAKIIDVLENDQQTIGAIIEELMNQQSNEITEIVYSSLFTLYHDGTDVQKAFVLHFIPALLWEYLYISSNHGKKGHGKLEAVLLAIYNAEVLDENGEIKFFKFRLPSLSQPSVYHEPLVDKMSTSALTESALSRHEQSEVMYRLNGPGYKLSRIPTCHRFAVVGFVLEQYNSYITFMGDASLNAACKMATRAASCGFKNLCDKTEDGNFESLSKCSRIPLDNATIIQLVYIVYYAMYNGFSQSAIRAFQALHFRAAHSLFSPAYQLTLSIDHLLNSGKKQSLDGPLGLTIHTTSSESVSKLKGDSPDQLPRCFDTNSTPWKRRCPYEILIAEKPVPEKLEVDSGTKLQVDRKLKVPKDSRPRKAKSWTSSPSAGKLSPAGTSTIKSPETAELVIEMKETRYSNIELLTGV